MTFVFDIDGTIARHPKVFRELMTALKAGGHDVHILTGHIGPDTEEERAKAEDARLEQLIEFRIGSQRQYDQLRVAIGTDGVEVARLKAAVLRHWGCRHVH